MEQFKAVALKYLKFAAGNASTYVETGIIIAVALIVGAIILKIAAKTLDFSMADFNRALTCLIITGIIALAANTAFEIYALPKLANPTVAKSLMIALQVILLAGVLMPLCVFIMKGRYGWSAFPAMLGIVAFVIVVFGLKAAIGAIKEGDKGMNKTRNRTEEVNTLIGK